MLRAAMNFFGFLARFDAGGRFRQPCKGGGSGARVAFSGRQGKGGRGPR